MSFARLAVVAALAAAAVVPATAEAVLVCVAPEPYLYVCKDTARPECIVYGSLGAEADFSLGSYCR
jgi:hypothetical protein